tara:strand:- start:1015 stop:1383 length:369 start_codon:yes stop_codon:yes gene_type:complete
MKDLLETFDNPQKENDYLIKMDIPEFTCICPLTSQPDFAEFYLEYVPDKHCVELKSLKLYMGSYREVGAFHEDITNQIFNDLYGLIKPRFMRIDAHWKVRGGITTYVEVKKSKLGWKNSNNF